MNNDFKLSSLISSAVVCLLVWIYYSGSFYSQELRYSTFWPRLWTGSIDSLILWPLGAIAALISSHSKDAIIVAAVLIIQETVEWIYSIGMHTKYGQTVGKMVCKVKIVDARTELPITFKQAFIRDAIPLVLGLGFLIYTIYGELSTGHALVALAKNGYQGDPYFFSLLYLSLGWFLIEVLTMLTNKKRRALHDFIAGTVVVRTNTDGVDLAHPMRDGRSPAV